MQQSAFSSPCLDKDGNGARDTYGFGCAQYTINPQECGQYDDDDFTAGEMCCGCKHWSPPTNATSLEAVPAPGPATPEEIATAAETLPTGAGACNTLTDIKGNPMVCPQNFKVHPEQSGMCINRAKEGPNDPRLYKFPSGKSWPNSMWAIPVPGKPTLGGSSWYFDHGLYITNGAPPTVCDPPVVIEEGNVTMIANAAAKAQYDSAGAGAATNSPNGTEAIDTSGMHAALEGKCAYGYELRDGELNNYGNCPGSHEFGYCILEADKANKMCEDDPRCSGVTESSNPQWQKDYPGLQMLGKLPLYANTDWKTCMKAAAGRTWDHLTLLEKDRGVRHSRAPHAQELDSMAQLQLSSGRATSDAREARAKTKAEAFVGGAAALGKKWH
jgi:hypothetical protein